MSKEWRVAFIGCGKRAQAHVAAVQAETRGRVVAVADMQATAAQAMAATLGGGVAVYTDYHTLLAEARPDVVITCLWTPLHLPVFRDCVAAGVQAVLSEKPMAPTWGACGEIARLADSSGCLLTFCHQRRFARGNRLVRQWLAEGRFGAIQRMDLYSPQNLLDCGTHTFDQALSFNNETPAKWVLGAVDPTKLLTWFDVEAESLAVGTVVFANGVRAAFQVGGPDMDLPSGVRVYGSEGFVEVTWDGEIRRAVVYRDPSWTPPKIEEPTAEHMFGVIRNAFDCLESGAEPELSWRKALRAEEIIFALYESVRRRAAVTLPLTGVTDNPFHALLHAGAFAGGAG